MCVCARACVRACVRVRVLCLQENFRSFCVKNPAALLLFLRLAVGRLHRVSNFVISEFLCLSLPVRQDVIMLRSEVEDVANSEGLVPGGGGGHDEMDRSQRVSAEAVSSWLEGDGLLASAVEVYEPGVVLFSRDDTPKAFWVMLEGEITVTDKSSQSDPADATTASSTGSCSTGSTGGTASAADGREEERGGGVTVVGKACVLGARQFLTAVERKATAVVTKPTRMARFDIEALIHLAGRAPTPVVDLVLLAAQSLFPTIKQFTTLGLSRHWHNAGDTLFRQGEPAGDKCSEFNMEK